MLLLKALASTRQEALASQKALLPDILLIGGNDYQEGMNNKKGNKEDLDNAIHMS